MSVVRAISVEGFVLMVENVNDQRRGYLFEDRGEVFLPKSFSNLSLEAQIKLLKEEIDVYCRWSADDQFFGGWNRSDFINMVPPVFQG